MDNQYSGHIKSNETYNGIELTVPSDKNWFLVIVFTPFILIWVIVEIILVYSFILNRQNGFPPLIWFFGWTAAGAFAIRMWLWHTIGKTKISLQNSRLTIRKQNDIFSNPKHFELGKIQNLHIQNRDIEKTKYFTRPNYLLTDKTKTIAFEYKDSTIRAIDWLNIADANYLFNKLNANIGTQ